MGKLRDIATGVDWQKIPNSARIAMLEADAEIERLRAALKPFSDMAGEMFARNFEHGLPIIALDNPDDLHRIDFSDFIAARTAYVRDDEVAQAPTVSGVDSGVED